MNNKTTHDIINNTLSRYDKINSNCIFFLIFVKIFYEFNLKKQALIQFNFFIKKLKILI